MAGLVIAMASLAGAPAPAQLRSQPDISLEFHAWHIVKRNVSTDGGG